MIDIIASIHPTGSCRAGGKGTEQAVSTILLPRTTFCMLPLYLQQQKHTAASGSFVVVAFASPQLINQIYLFIFPTIQFDLIVVGPMDRYIVCM